MRPRRPADPINEPEHYAVDEVMCQECDPDGHMSLAPDVVVAELTHEANCGWFERATDREAPVLLVIHRRREIEPS